MASILKNVYIGKLDGIVNKHNNTYRTIKMRPVDGNCKGTILKEFSLEKIIQRKGNKLYVKPKDFDSSFNS